MHHFLRALDVAGAERVDKDAVILHDLRMAYRQEAHLADAVEVHGHALEHFITAVFPTDFKHPLVECVVVAQQTRRVAAREARVLQQKIVLEEIEVLLARHAAGKGDGGNLHRLAHEARLLDLLVVDEGDHAAVLREDVHYPALAQLDERLPHRRAGEAHRRGKFLFADDAAGFEGKRNDVVPNCPDGVVARRFLRLAFEYFHDNHY